jgi:hypothetical protein
MLSWEVRAHPRNRAAPNTEGMREGSDGVTSFEFEKCGGNLNRQKQRYQADKNPVRHSSST